ncbi:STAS domain-containing protein [Streptomyces sp. WMMB303]|uniref:STAS domain-containing protein n=1 Tax=Streptomyces sp. WMMB303 TaxID=3034154 RepID=UPI0023ED8A15|nr:STAS domain-containing protein [Streptomyces sp. WMMB303]MDF4251751.1 STAS domain-containing protein [Streptomyces sp. WMMB303]
MAPHPDASGSRLSSTAPEQLRATAEQPWAGGAGTPGEGAEAPAGTVLTRAERGRSVVELHGEIDLAVVLATTPRLYALTAAPAPQLVADLRPVTFIDCSGLALLVDIRARVLASGGSFTLVCADPRVLRLLRITGLEDVLVPVPAPEALPEQPDRNAANAARPADGRADVPDRADGRDGADGPDAAGGRKG